MPGIFCQTVVFGAINTGIGLSDDLQKGLIERFRSLPMARSAVLAGRTLRRPGAQRVRGAADADRRLPRRASGSRPTSSACWPGIGRAAAVRLLDDLDLRHRRACPPPSPETAQAMSFPILAPLVFASSAFVSTSTMPGWLQVFANHQPVTAAVNATRALMLGGPTATYVWQSLAWSVGIVAVFAPFAIRRYRRVAWLLGSRSASLPRSGSAHPGITSPAAALRSAASRHPCTAHFERLHPSGSHPASGSDARRSEPGQHGGGEGVGGLDHRVVADALEPGQRRVGPALDEAGRSCPTPRSGRGRPTPRPAATDASRWRRSTGSRAGARSSM